MKWFNVVAIALMMVLGTHALAEDSTATKAKPLTGKVTAVAPDSADSKITNITVTHGKKGDTSTETIVKATADTKVTKGKEKEAATLSDVVVGVYAIVTADADGKATAIQVIVPKKKPATPSK